VTDRQTDTVYDGKDRAMQSVAQVKIVTVCSADAGYYWNSPNQTLTLSLELEPQFLNLSSGC